MQAHPAQTCADDIAARIIAIARDGNIGADALKVDERPPDSTIVVGDQLVVTVLEADARANGIERVVLAQVDLQKIVRSIARYRSDRQREALVRGVGFAASMNGWSSATPRVSST